MWSARTSATAPLTTTILRRFSTFSILIRSSFMSRAWEMSEYTMLKLWLRSNTSGARELFSRSNTLKIKTQSQCLCQTEQSNFLTQFHKNPKLSDGSTCHPPKSAWPTLKRRESSSQQVSTEPSSLGIWTNSSATTLQTSKQPVFKSSKVQISSSSKKQRIKIKSARKKST